METVIHTISNDNKEDDLDDTRISSDSSISDIDFNNDPYYNFDISNHYLDFQPGWNIGFLLLYYY